MQHSKGGRNFIQGKASSPDLRQLIIDECILQGGNQETKTIPYGTYSTVANHFRVAISFVRKLWRQYCLYGHCEKKRMVVDYQKSWARQK
jgi:hypothetical protein